MSNSLVFAEPNPLASGSKPKKLSPEEKANMLSKQEKRKQAYLECSESTLSPEVRTKFEDCRNKNKIAITMADKRSCMKEMPAEQRAALLECVRKKTL